METVVLKSEYVNRAKDKRRSKTKHKAKSKAAKRKTASSSSDEDEDVAEFTDYDSASSSAFMMIDTTLDRGAEEDAAVFTSTRLTDRHLRTHPDYFLLDNCNAKTLVGRKYISELYNYKPIPKDSGQGMKGISNTPTPIIGTGILKRTFAYTDGTSKEYKIKVSVVDTNYNLLSYPTLREKGFIMGPDQAYLETPSKKRIPIVLLGGFPAIRATSLTGSPCASVSGKTTSVLSPPRRRH